MKNYSIILALGTLCILAGAFGKIYHIPYLPILIWIGFAGTNTYQSFYVSNLEKELKEEKDKNQKIN